MSGNRQIQTTEKNFFDDSDLKDIPAIAVFTRFDELEERRHYKLEQQFRRDHPGVLPPDQDLSAHAHANAIRNLSNYRSINGMRH